MFGFAEVYFGLMEWMNYNHLFYFWMVAREGSLTRACEKMLLAPSTVSGQIRGLENVLGEKLFVRCGRNLMLTDSGNVVLNYAEEIFTTGRELQDVLKGRPVGRTLSLRIGVADVLTKLVVFRLITPVYDIGQPVQVICHDDKGDKLLAQLALYELDVVLLDSPIPPSVRIRAFNHLLGQCDVLFMAAEPLASQCRRDYPLSLDGQPFLLPLKGTMLRHLLDQWFDTHKIHPIIAGEFDDSALLKVFGQAGKGIVAVPSVSEKEVANYYHLHSIGLADGISERFYAISPERKVQHPAVAAICNSARLDLFA